MTENALFAGPALRRLRKRGKLTQAAMAGRLGISPSYLNLIERNQRPLTARVIMQLVAEFEFDPRTLREDTAIGGLDGLVRRLADERFSDLTIDREEIDEFLSASPQIAAAFARLYDSAGSGEREHSNALTASRREIEKWRNHFADLDSAAEELSDEIRLSRGDVASALVERLRERHQLSVRVLPREVMPDAVRRLDLHARQIQLSEMLSPESRVFHLAVQLAQIEKSAEIANLASGGEFDDDSGRRLFERHLEAYFAAALIMPYGRFLRACQSTGYDLPVLQRRFGVSFEQLAHRLTTLQRVGQRGLPFFMARLDRAGQFSKRFVGASQASFLEARHACPRWIATSAFERPGDLLTQTISLDGGGAGPAGWFTAARTVSGGGMMGEARFVIVLGLDVSLADSLASARGQSLRQADATEMGPGCRHCHVERCQQRSLPPLGRKLQFDRIQRGASPFAFAGQNSSD
jgi:predicted transcriptional regulator/DNA-binding XRE family transcriptional regulator